MRSEKKPVPEDDAQQTSSSLWEEELVKIRNTVARLLRCFGPGRSSV